MPIICSSSITGLNLHQTGSDPGNVPKIYDVPHNSSSVTITYTFNAESSTGMPGHGGQVFAMFNGWQHEYWYGLIDWHNAGGGGALNTVYATSIISSGLSVSVAVGDNDDDIDIEISGVHNNGHAWVGKIIAYE